MSLKSILSDIGGFISKLASVFKSSTAAGLSIANEIKNAVDSPLADLIVNLTSTNLDNEALILFRNWLTIFLNDLNLTQSVSYGVERAISEASATISQMALPASKAGTLNTIAAAINQKVAELKGEVMPIETALSIQQIAYKQPELLK